MEELACSVIRGKISRIKKSNVDPAELSGELLARGIIGTNDVQKASLQGNAASERRGELFLTIMGNGAPGTFFTLVEILLRKPEWKWLGEELKGTASSQSRIKENVHVAVKYVDAYMLGKYRFVSHFCS